LGYYLFILLLAVVLFALSQSGTCFPIPNHISDLMKNLGYGVSGSLVVSFLLDFGATKARCKQNNAEWARLTAQFKGRLETLKSRFCTDTISQYAGTDNMLSKTKLFFGTSKPIYEKLFFFHAERIMASYMELRNQAYNMLAFVQAHSGFEDKEKDVLCIIKSIDSIENSYKYFVGVSVPAGFYDRRKIYEAVTSFHNAVKQFDEAIYNDYFESTNQKERGKEEHVV